MPSCPQIAIQRLKELNITKKPQHVRAGQPITLKSGWTMKPLHCWMNTMRFCKENPSYQAKFGFQIVVKSDHRVSILLHAMPVKNGKIFEITPTPQQSITKWFCVYDNGVDFNGAYMTTDFKASQGKPLMVPTVAYHRKTKMPIQAYPNDVSYASWRFISNHYRMQERFMHWNDIRDSHTNKLDEDGERESICNALGELNLD